MTRPVARRGGQGSRPGAACRLLLAGVALLLATTAWGAKEVPFLAARVNDLAGLLQPADRERLETKLADLERRTGAQVAALTVDSLDGDTIEDYAVRVFQTWKLGRKDVNDGVLFVVAKQERRMRIEVGYGLEARLTDARSRQILDDIVRPQFRAGNFAAGIEAGLDAIAAVIQGASLPPPPRRPLGSQIGSIVGILFFAFMFLSVVGTFSVVALLTPGTAGWFLYLFLAPFYAIFPSVIFPPYGGVVMGGAWLILFPIVRALINTPAGTKFRKQRGWVITPSSGGGSWSGGGFSSGGGGFSGGGGSSGGGGASSGW